MLIGVDGSTRRTGFAFAGPDARAPRTGVWVLPGAADDVLDVTLARASESLLQLCGLTRATHVVIEAPIHIPERSAHTMMALVQLTGALRAAAARAGCVVRCVSSQTVRAHFIGHGNLKSADAERRIAERCAALGWAAETHDARDAAATWSWGMAEYFPASPGAQAGARTPLLAPRRAA